MGKDMCVRTFSPQVISANIKKRHVKTTFVPFFAQDFCFPKRQGGFYMRHPLLKEKYLKMPHKFK
jgi:hypothetical protein